MSLGLFNSLGEHFYLHLAVKECMHCDVVVPLDVTSRPTIIKVCGSWQFFLSKMELEGNSFELQMTITCKLKTY